MTTLPAFNSFPSSPTEPHLDVTWGRPQFRPPALERIFATLDFSAFAAELSQAGKRLVDTLQPFAPETPVGSTVESD